MALQSLLRNTKVQSIPYKHQDFNASQVPPDAAGATSGVKAALTELILLLHAHYRVGGSCPLTASATLDVCSLNTRHREKAAPDSESPISLLTMLTVRAPAWRQRRCSMSPDCSTFSAALAGNLRLLLRQLQPALQTACLRTVKASQPLPAPQLHVSVSCIVHLCQHCSTPAKQTPASSYSLPLHTEDEVWIQMWTS